MPTTRRYCVHGHDTWLVGRTQGSGNCRRCHQLRRPTPPPYEDVKWYPLPYSEDPEAPTIPCRASGSEPSPVVASLVADVGPLEPWLELYRWLATANGHAPPWEPVTQQEADSWGWPLTPDDEKALHGHSHLSPQREAERALRIEQRRRAQSEEEVREAARRERIRIRRAEVMRDRALLAMGVVKD